MADLLTQTWVPGNVSAVMQTALYYQGSPNNDVPTSQYPRVFGSEKVQVTSGELAWFSGAGGAETDAGLCLQLASVADGTTGSIEADVTYTATSVSLVLISAGGTSLFNVFRHGVPTTILSGVTALNAFLFKSGPDWKVQILYRLTTDGISHSADATLSSPVVAGDTDTWRLCWVCSGSGAGSATVYRNGVSVHTVTGLNLTLKGDTGIGAADDFDLVSVGWQAFPGGEGLAGTYGPISVRTTCGAGSPEIPANNSAECCASPAVEGSGVTAPGAGVERAVLLSGAWAGRCEGGGTVALLPDLTDAESWADS